MENKTLNSELPKIIGRIEIPITKTKAKVNLLGNCADCDAPFKDIHDQVKIIRTYVDKSSTTRYVCEFCADELFADGEPKSIFD